MGGVPARRDLPTAIAGQPFRLGTVRRWDVYFTGWKPVPKGYMG